ncbi:4Fe-4S binding protein [Thalassospira sp. TSL5-1]|uniref:4Fe-4S binding protein n=1 Tax=Thalassospira sp. TSL5-1 TaxID=1544451 RepID=UPI0009F9742F|nr:4Fe-4S binding protein [Thalassospira sp. TSL5-1]
MTIFTKTADGSVAAPTGRLLAFGMWLRRHQVFVRRLQWAVVGIYAFLLIVPVVMPLPGLAAHIWNNITVFAQFVFWGIWWPGVLVSMLLFGRLWCGLLCPEGALTEFASRHGRGRAIPRWIKWPGWPFVAFVLTTVYGQMTSVYQYPAPVLLVLGGSTVGAVIVGYLYGRNKRVWCRYLCPVNGVFGLLAKLAPMRYGVDRAKWDMNAATHSHEHRFNCAPLVPVKNMESPSPCHMCGRCSGFHDAVALQARQPNDEIVNLSGRTATKWDSLLIITGLMGVAIGAFEWSASPWFVAIKQMLAMALVNHNIIWPLQATLPWWILTNYAAQNDVLTVLDGVVLLGYIATTALVLSVLIAIPLKLACVAMGRGGRPSFYHLSHALIPLAACGVILGLSAQTVTLLRADGFALGWVPMARLALLVGATLWSLWLGAAILWHRDGGIAQKVAASALFALGLAAPVYAWVLMFWVW